MPHSSRSPAEIEIDMTALAIVALVASFTVLIILVSAQAMARSRAGLGLTMVAVFGALALAYWDRRAARGKGHRGASGVTPAKVLLGATALGIVLSVQFALYRVMERFVAIDPLEDTRTFIARSTIEAAKGHMPFGSGMGTFVPVYAMYEKVQDTLINGYVNHAHDDILELWLETGVVGIVLMGVFVMWLVLRSMKIWRRGPAWGSRSRSLPGTRGDTDHRSAHSSFFPRLPTADQRHDGDHGVCLCAPDRTAARCRK